MPARMSTQNARLHARLLAGLAAVTLALAALPTMLVAQDSQEQVVERRWPKELPTAEGGKLVVYQPQVETWTNFARLEGRVAMAYSSAAGRPPEVGTARIVAATEVSLDTRLTRIHSLVLEDVRFPALSTEQSNVLAAELKRHADGKEMVVELDRLVADVEEVATQTRQLTINTDPPQIFISTTPAIMVQFDGEPVVSPIQDSEVTFVVNTNWDLLQDPTTDQWYLRNEDAWLEAASLSGPWAASTAPDSFSTLPDDPNWSDVRGNLSGRAIETGQAPQVFTSQTPAELILIDGESELSRIPDSNVLWVTNTESDLFLSAYDGLYYYLVSGRWFRTNDLMTGTWTFASRSLPPDFGRIPDNHPSSHVLASVPGTPQAEEAVILAQIPQKATVDRDEVEAPEVQYQGEPTFESIPGTEIARAVNTSNDILRVGDLYYLCVQAVWFRSTQPTGPWEVADDVPASVYTISASSPSHHVTYVVVEDSSPSSVSFSFTTGYIGMYYGYGWNTMVWGTGWYYPPYVYYGGYSPIYYPYPMSYGGGSWYNPATGTYGRSVRGYGPYGGAGYGAAYNPRTGTYARGAAAYGPYGAGRQAVAFNPRTGTMAATRQGTNYYEAWGTSAVVRGVDWVRTARYANDDVRAGAFTTSRGGTGFAAIDDDNNLYAGRDGNVYRRDDDGQWQRRQDGNWSNVDSPSAEQRTQARERAGAAGAEGTRTIGQLNRDARSRDRGSQRVQRARGGGSVGGGGFGGGGRGRARGRRR